MKRQFKKRYVVFAVLLLLLIAIAGVAIWQRENIRAIFDYMQYSSEELEAQLQQNDQAIKDAVNAAPEVTIRDITDEEREALKEGSISREELIDSLISGETEPEPVPELPVEPKPDANVEHTPTPVPTAAPKPTPVPDKSDYERKLSELVAQVYVLREEYIIKLDELFEEAKAVYFAMPASQRTTTWRADLVSSYLAKGTALEKDCDRRMDDIVTQMKTLIKENKGDMTLVDTVIETYANEKRLKKAWYMSKLEEKGWL